MSTLRQAFAAATGGYSSTPKPLGAYMGLIFLFHALYGGVGAGLARRAEGLPARYSIGDLVLCGTAVHKLSRLIARDRVTAPLRAPFTRFEKDAGHGEVEETPRGEGIQNAVGELLVCPHCIGLWTSAGFTLGLVRAPRVTRMVAFTFTALTLADLLQIAYRALEDAS